MRPSATSVWGLKLLVSEALSYLSKSIRQAADLPSSQAAALICAGKKKPEDSYFISPGDSSQRGIGDSFFLHYARSDVRTLQKKKCLFWSLFFFCSGRPLAAAHSASSTHLFVFAGGGLDLSRCFLGDFLTAKRSSAPADFFFKFRFPFWAAVMTNSYRCWEESNPLSICKNSFSKFLAVNPSGKHKIDAIKKLRFSFCFSCFEWYVW